MKDWIIGLLLILIIVLLAIIGVFNIPTDYSITIQADDNTLRYILIHGQRPGITVLSLQDTPYDNIKILYVRSHFIWGSGFHDTNQQLSTWLDELNIKSFPDYPIHYIGK